MQTFLQNQYEATILIVDDTPANLEVLATMLKARGYQIRIAPSGRLALQFVARTQPDLILLDISMPDMDGYEVCRRLKEHETWRSIPVIFISALNNTQGKLRSFAAGGVDYITKPFHCAEVEARVETHIKLNLYQRYLEVMIEKKACELAQAQEKVARAEKISIVGVMSAGIAHEINQPLNAIKLISSNLVLSHAEGRKRDISEYVDNMKEISRQADRIKDSIEHLRAFIRNDRKHLHSLNLNAVIGNVLRIVGKQLNSHGIRITLSLQKDLADIWATTTGLETVLINLLINSMHALGTLEPSDRSITVKTYMNRDIILEVMDNGPGIASELRTRIFEPFVSAQNSADNLGLGLAIANNIISSYKGRIELVSGAESRTVFRVIFPVGKEA
ncbi:sensor histidine kinase [Sporomusa aerivorans]|uniref:sensor histidine kinase n=1 Tax=Sporomusa aerivorans TaxID=204936 RepID=UPI003529DA6E